MKRALLIVALVALSVTTLQAHTRPTTKPPGGAGDPLFTVGITYRQNIAAIGETPVYQTADAVALNCPESDKATAVACAFTVLQHGAIIIDDRSVVIVSPEVIENATAYTAVR